MTDQPSYAAESAPDQAYPEESAQVDSAPFESSDPSDQSEQAYGRSWADLPDSTPDNVPEPMPDNMPAQGPEQGPQSGRESDAERTGVPEVDALLSVLDDLDVLPIEHHAQVFAEAHQRLHQALLSADEE